MEIGEGDDRGKRILEEYKGKRLRERLRERLSGRG